MDLGLELQLGLRMRWIKLFGRKIFEIGDCLLQLGVGDFFLRFRDPSILDLPLPFFGFHIANLGIAILEELQLIAEISLLDSRHA